MPQSTYLDREDTFRSYDAGFEPEKREVKVPALAWDIAATLLLPEGFDESKTYPAIVSAHPIGSCKEQTAGDIYGPALAREGYVVIAFDASFQGESGGEPRFIEDPAQRVEDFSHVVDYLVRQDFVDADRIGVLGICGGGGYTLAAAKTEKRFKAAVSVTGANMGRLMNEAFSEYDPVSALEAMGAQRTREARGEELQVNPFIPPSPEAAKEAGATEADMYEATLYYLTGRGQAENGCTRALFSHQAQSVAWDAFAKAETLLTQPVMIVIGDVPGAFGAYRDGNEIYARAASKDKELVVVENASHYDLYDGADAVGTALESIVPFFAKHL